MTDLEKQVEDYLMGNKKKKEVVFSTNCTLLDLVVGGGERMGYPAGRIINIVGDSSSGKTFLAVEMLARAIHEYGDKVKHKFIDAESGFSFDTQKLYGVDLNVDRVNTVEELYGDLRSFCEGLKSDQVGLYITDSLDGLDSKQTQEIQEDRYKAYKKGKEYDEGSYLTKKAKFLSQEFFPATANLLEDKNVLFVVISQTRQAIGSMFKKQIRAGGKALDFYTYVCIWTANIYKMKKLERNYGVVLKTKADKSKTPRPYRKCTFSILFDYGIDDVGSNIDYLFDLRGEDGKLKKAANNILWDGEEPTVPKLKQFLEDNNLKQKFKEEFSNNFKKDNLLNFIEELGDKGKLSYEYQKLKDFMIRKEFDI